MQHGSRERQHVQAECSACVGEGLRHHWTVIEDLVELDDDTRYCHRHIRELIAGLRMALDQLTRDYAALPTVDCIHEYWYIQPGGRTVCRTCGADTTNMDAMGG